MSTDDRMPALSAQQFPAATFYVVATPIGNLADLSLRALDCLRIVDAVAAEDTRMAKRLLAHYAIAKPCFAAHRHNEREAGSAIVSRLQAGERVAYVSDAGTPAISDPGAFLVDAVRTAGFRVVPIPGASAVTCALSAAGLASEEQPGSFYFHGFLPPKRVQAEAVLRPLVGLRAKLVFYEAPHRVLDTVALLADVFGNGGNSQRRIVIARELTKIFETIHSCALGEAREWLSADANRQRGEFVLIVEGAVTREDPIEAALPVLRRLMKVLPLSEAVDLSSELTHASRKALYSHALKFKAENEV